MAALRSPRPTEKQGLPMNHEGPFRLQSDRAVPRWGLLALAVLIIFGVVAYVLISRSPEVTLTAQGDASSGDRAYLVDVRTRSSAEQIDLPRLRAHIRLRDGRGQFRIRAEELPGDKDAVTYVLREPWYRPDRRGETKIAVLAAEAPRGSSPAPSPKEPPASDEWGSAPPGAPSAVTQPPAGAAAVVPPSQPEAAPPATAPPAAAPPTTSPPPVQLPIAAPPAVAPPPTATLPPAQAPVAAPSAAPPPTLAQPTMQAPVTAPPTTAPVEPPAASPPPAFPSPQPGSGAPTATSPPREAAPSEEAPTESAPAEVEEPPAPSRSAWARDRALESELAGRGVTGVTILRNGRSIRLRGTVGNDGALRTLYQFMNDKGFGEVSYGVEVR